MPDGFVLWQVPCAYCQAAVADAVRTILSAQSALR